MKGYIITLLHKSAAFTCLQLKTSKEGNWDPARLSVWSDTLTTFQSGSSQCWSDTLTTFQSGSSQCWSDTLTTFQSGSSQCWSDTLTTCKGYLNNFCNHSNTLCEQLSSSRNMTASVFYRSRYTKAEESLPVF